MGNILIIDDDKDIRNLVTAYLTHAGHTISQAENGQDGVAQAGETPPDLIILDINMPVMDGTRVMKALNESPETAKIPVIALSGVSIPEMRDDMYQLGCRAFVQKPIDFDVLLGTVSSVLAQ